MRRNSVLILLFCLLFTPFSLHAVELDFSGYATFGMVAIDDEDLAYESAVGSEINFNYNTVMGFGTDVEVDENIDFKFQIKGSVADGNFHALFDIAQFTWQSPSTYKVRAGLMRYPVWMISDYIDVGILYPWSRAPVELYYIKDFSRYTGASVIWNRDLNGKKLEYELFAGGGSNGDTSTSKFVGTLSNLLGINVMLMTGPWTHRLGIVRVDVDATLTYENALPDINGATPTGGWNDLVIDFELPSTVYSSLGSKFDNNKWLFMFEASQFQLDEDAPAASSLSYYVTAGKRIKEKTLLHLTYSHYNPEEKASATSRLGKQTSIALGANYSLSENTVLKTSIANTTTTDGPGGFADSDSDPSTPSEVDTFVYDLSLSLAF